MTTDDGSTPLGNPRHEAFAAALARGASVRQATAEANFTRDNVQRMIDLANSATIAARVATLRRQRFWGGRDELADVYDEMMRLARAADDLKSGAALDAKCRLLTEAGRLAERASQWAAGGREPYEAAQPIVPPTLSKEEWLAAFAPKS